LDPGEEIAEAADPDRSQPLPAALHVRIGGDPRAVKSVARPLARLGSRNSDNGTKLPAELRESN